MLLPVTRFLVNSIHSIAGTGHGGAVASKLAQLSTWLRHLFPKADVIAFHKLIGRTIGRDWILQVAAGNDRFRALDTVISREGFKIVLLLRLSPLFPFALSNYLYGLTSVPFWDYFWGTLIGCVPRARSQLGRAGAQTTSR